MRLNPYLFFNGNCEEAFNVYAKLLGGKIEMMMAHKGSPAEAHVAGRNGATRSCMRGSASATRCSWPRTPRPTGRTAP